ncbi:Ig-like domain-containing protein [Sanguibacter sp. Leaf3]|uniref:Ig-like domain-containing protein n=1 Tax=Sanguibacter sp. Leaf3 TaxID=1736209 RepID=UPI0006F684C9|nr:Ig-like domain-containing protein [Sanguibacter sp. Leaf3]KQT96550.1 hypothetical protein ASG53_15790 [Sanguibacter sp. Leaf3]
MRTRRTQATHPSRRRTEGLRRLAAAALALPLALGTLAATALPATADEDPATISHSQEAIVGVASTASFTCVDRADQPVASALWQAGDQASQRVTNPTPGSGYLTFSRDVTFGASGIQLLFLTCEYAAVDGTTAPSSSTNVLIHVRYETVATDTAVSFTPERVEPGGDVTVSAKVTTASGPVTEGTVNFSIGALELGGRDVGTDGVATLTIPGLAPGAYTVEAAYYGTEILEASVSDSTVWVKTPTTVTTVVPDMVRAPHTVLRATPVPVSGFPAPTGTVTFGYSEGAILGTATVVAGEAVLELPGLAPGVYDDVYAVYSGDGSYGGASSGRTTMTVNPAQTFKATPTVKLTVPAKISTPKVEVSVAVTGEVIWTLADVTAASPVPSTPTGTVTVRFVKGGTPYTATLVDGVATFTVDAPAPGTYEVEASYSGDDFYWAASDVTPTVVEAPVVTPPVTPTPDLTGSTTTLAPGEKITLVARGFLPGETVEFVLHSDPVVLGTAEADADGVATLVVALPAGVPAGEHHVEATGMTSLRTAQIPVTVIADVTVVTPPVVTAPVVTVPVAAAPVAAAPVLTAPVVAVVVPAAPLASTGAELGSTALLVSVLLGSGVLLVVGRRRFGALAG